MHLKSRFSQLFVTLLASLLALVTLLLAWPRLNAAIRFLPVDIAVERYYRDQQIPTNRMLTLAGFAEEAITTHEHYRYHDALSLLYYLRGLDVYTPALERRGAYRSAESRAVETVKRAPVQPEAWFRIAQVRAVLRDEPDVVIEPWKMSVFTGRTHATLLAPRAGIGLVYLEWMDGETAAMLRDQLLLAWELKPRELLAELKQRDPRLQNTRRLIAAIDPMALAEMEELIETVR